MIMIYWMLNSDWIYYLDFYYYC